MPKLILHIGAHKTGTTSIQRFLEDNTSLLAEHGYVFPRICWYSHSQHRLSLAVKGGTDPNVGDKPQLEAELKALRDFLATSKNHVIISSEVFLALPEHRVRLFYEGLKGIDMQVVACIRRQDNLFASTYNQGTKHAGNKLTRPISFHLDNPLSLSPELDLLGCLNTWASLFGRERLTVYRYESGDAVTTFLQQIKFPGAGQVKPAKRSNVAVPAKALELMRLVKTMNQDIAVQNIVLGEAARVFAGTGSVLLGPFDRTKILRRFEADNEKLFTEYLGSENLYAEKYWSEEFRQPGMEATEPLNRKDVLQVVVELASLFAWLGISPELLHESKAQKVQEGDGETGFKEPNILESGELDKPHAGGAIHKNSSQRRWVT